MLCQEKKMAVYQVGQLNPKMNASGNQNNDLKCSSLKMTLNTNEVNCECPIPFFHATTFGTLQWSLPRTKTQGTAAAVLQLHSTGIRRTIRGSPTESTNWSRQQTSVCQSSVTDPQQRDHDPSLLMDLKEDHLTSTDGQTTRNLLPYATHLIQSIRLARQTKQHVSKGPNMAASSCVWCQDYKLGGFYCSIIGGHSARQDNWPSIQ